MEITVREFNVERDCVGAESMEQTCEVSPSGTMSLFTDLLGDPICRIRHSPAFRMLVAVKRVNGKEEIVGLIRGSIKTVTCGKKIQRTLKHSCAVTPVYTKVAYILGLRVSPRHRRRGIGLKLVTSLESWFKQNGAEYAYVATDKSNHASFHLFNTKCGYSKFRTPSILVHPVHAGHRLPIDPMVSIVEIPTSQAEYLYRANFSTTEFFPRDIDSVLRNKLSLGTFLAVRSSDDDDKKNTALPDSWAVVSVWDLSAVYRLQVKGAGWVHRALAWGTRVLDRGLPWLSLPSVPDLFNPFGAYFMYGLFGVGPDKNELVKALCRHVHNMAREAECAVVVTELAGADPMKEAVPHWRALSYEEDLWCIKRIADDYSDGEVGDWTKSEPAATLFVDPREL